MHAPLRAFDFCSGAGGFSLGLRKAGIETAYAAENAPHARASFGLHHPSTQFFLDARTVSWKALRGEIDILAGSPPCTPWSSSKPLTANAEDDPRNLIPAWLRALDELRPPLFLMENVPGLRAGAKGAYLTTALKTCDGLGYEIREAVLDAADYGVPQHRRRLFVMGWQHGVLDPSRFAWPSPTHGTDQPWVTVGQALPHRLGLPLYGPVVYAKNPVVHPSYSSSLLFNGHGRCLILDRPAKTISAQFMGQQHFWDTLQQVPAYHRHLLDGGAPRVGTLKGGSRLSLLEMAVLMGFDPTMPFVGTDTQVASQIGNAVPPPLARAVGQSLIHALRASKRPT